VAAQQRAEAARPGDRTILSNLGIALREAGRLEESAATFDRAIALAPEDPALRWDRAQALLHLGRYAEGWADYEARLAMPGTPLRPPPEPAWRGESLAGKTILLVGEQGFGDTILAARYVPLLKEAGARVVVQCRAELERLLRTLDGIDEVAVARRDPPTRCDVSIVMMSLPGRLGTRTGTIPPPARFAIPASEIERWRARLAGPPRCLRVGIVWSGSTTFRGNRQRALPLEAFLPLLRLGFVRLYSLQKGPPEAELDGLAAKSLIEPLGPSLGDFLDTAAALHHLDLVVMTDSGTAHLAATLGRPVWNLLSFLPYWLYGPSGETTPWYPTMRLFRQKRPGDWAAVFDAVLPALAALRDARQHAR
jgi:hypothetical protein